MSIFRVLYQALELLPVKLRRIWLLLIPIAILSAVLEALAISTIYVLIRLTDDPSVLQHSRLVIFLRQYLPTDTDAVFAAWFGLLVAFMYIAKNTVRLFSVFVRQYLTRRAIEQLSSHLLGRYLYAPYAFHVQGNTAKLIRNIEKAVPTLCNKILLSSTAIFTEVLVVIGVSSVVIWSAPFIAMVAISVICAVMMLLLWLTQRYHSLWGKQTHEYGGAIQAVLQQSLRGIKEIKVLGCETFFLNQYRYNRRELSRIGMWRGVLESVPHILVETFFICFVVALIFVLQDDKTFSNRLLPLLGLFAYAGLRILPSLHLIVFHLNNLRFGQAPTQELYNDWHTLAASAPQSDSEKSAQALPLNNQLIVSDISFTYPGSERPALQNISFSLKRGEAIGIVGRTGAGKSTLIDLLLGLIEPDSGRLLLDGESLTNRYVQWRHSVGFVPQEIFLTDESMRQNIALGIAPENIEQERIEAAINAAQLTELIKRLPQGLDTEVGERGIRLSGGERQRLAIARALYRNPQVLIFDEATSSLDYQTERALTHAINGLHGEKTLVIIAHRLSTVSQCDKILFLENGRLSAQGTYTELLQNNAGFQSLAHAAATE